MVNANVHGQSGAPSGTEPAPAVGVWGDSLAGVGVGGTSHNFYGIVASSDNWYGLAAYSDSKKQAAIYAHSINGAVGVEANVALGNAITAESLGGGGVGVFAASGSADGLLATSANGNAVNGYVESGTDDWAAGSFSNVKITGGRSSFIRLGLAGSFWGNVEILGNLMVSGTKGFRIDHPLDPANKYLFHSAVESPDMKNVYDGMAVLDAKGESSVTLPRWFQALNRDFRYQLTSVGGPAPNLHVAMEIHDNRFLIAGGVPGVKVSWQVTGIRQDAWAQAHPMPVEATKPTSKRGRFSNPELYQETKGKPLTSTLEPRLGTVLTAAQRAKTLHVSAKDAKKIRKQILRKTSTGSHRRKRD